MNFDMKIPFTRKYITTLGFWEANLVATCRDYPKIRKILQIVISDYLTDFYYGSEPYPPPPLPKEYGEAFSGDR